MCRKCYPLTNALYRPLEVGQQAKCSDWRVLERISENLYILCRSYDSYVRYLPLYIHTFRPCSARKPLEAAQLRRQYNAYEEIPNVWDRLRWLRLHKGLMQREVAQQLGITEAIYCDMENGVTQRMPAELAEKLAELYGVPREDFLDAFNQFLCDGQAARIRAYRNSLGMGRKPFARYTGIPLTSLRCWEDEKKVISRKCWERYFEGKI